MSSPQDLERFKYNKDFPPDVDSVVKITEVNSGNVDEAEGFTKKISVDTYEERDDDLKRLEYEILLDKEGNAKLKSKYQFPSIKILYCSGADIRRDDEIPDFLRDELEKLYGDNISFEDEGLSFPECVKGLSEFFSR